MIQVAKNREEVFSWEGVGVVIDVLRSATTVCALLKRGKKEIIVFGDKEKAAQYKLANPKAELFSELEFDKSIKKEDNSPYLASKSKASVPAIVVTTAGTPAVMALQKATGVFMGGFCNFYTLSSFLKTLKDDILVVPSSLFGYQDHVEDSICAESLAQFHIGFGDVNEEIANFKKSSRYASFLETRRKTGAKDAEMGLSLNSIPIVPVFKMYRDHAFVYRTDKMPADFYDTEKKESPLETAARAAREKEELRQEILRAAALAGEKKDEPASDEEITEEQESETAALLNVIKPDPKPVKIQEVKPLVFNPKSFKTDKRAVVLFSGGLDSTVCLYWAQTEGYECLPLTISYGQKHVKEIEAARTIAKGLGLETEEVSLELPWLAASSLVGADKEIPEREAKEIAGGELPSTYVPGRNLIFVSLAVSYAEVYGASAVVLGPNAVDFSGYPDCRPEFYKPLSEAVSFSTKKENKPGISLLTPLLKLTKADIIKLGSQLGAPLQRTWSCYKGGDEPCGECDSCKLRAKGFNEAGMRF